MPDPEPTFTMEHTEERYRVQLHQGEREYAVMLTRYGTGHITICPFEGVRREDFTFHQSNPNLVLAIGRLLVAVARKAGATDA